MPATSYPPAEEARTVTFRFLLTPQEKAQLVQLSRDRGVPVAEIVRTALPLARDAKERASA